jgi:regulatory protein
MPRITAIEPQEKNHERVSVFVEGKFALGLFADVAAFLGLRVGQEMTTERLTEVAQAETVRRAMESAGKLLGFRARSEREIRDRLTQKGYEPEVVEETITRLTRLGYLNDADFASRWVESRGKTRGSRALSHELRQKGVAPDIAAETLAESRDSHTEYATARAAAVRKVGEQPPDQSREAQTRLAAFLQRRGFGWDAIRPVLRELYQAEIEEE